MDSGVRNEQKRSYTYVFEKLVGNGIFVIFGLVIFIALLSLPLSDMTSMTRFFIASIQIKVVEYFHKMGQHHFLINRFQFSFLNI